MIQHEPRVGLEMLIENLAESEVSVSIDELEMLQAFAAALRLDPRFVAFLAFLVLQPE